MPIDQQDINRIDLGPYLQVGRQRDLGPRGLDAAQRRARRHRAPAPPARARNTAYGLTGPVTFTPYGQAVVYSSTDTPGTVGGTVPATLSLTLGAPAAFGAFTPGVDRRMTRARRRT